MKKTIREPNERMATTALSYVGPVRLKERYGNIMLTGVHGFITTNRQSPEMTGFGKIFSGKLSLDLNFLSAEISREKASVIINGIKAHILDVIHKK